MEDTGGVNHKVRRRPYGARDKEELIKKIISLHNKVVLIYTYAV